MTDEMILRAAQKLISSYEIDQALGKGKVMGILALLGELDKERNKESGAGNELVGATPIKEASKVTG